MNEAYHRLQESRSAASLVRAKGHVQITEGAGGEYQREKSLGLAIGTDQLLLHVLFLITIGPLRLQ